MSSSAVDTMQILYSVKGFWEKVDWLNSDEESELAKHVAGDINRFAIVYFDSLIFKIENSDSMKINGDFFNVPVEMSVAVANFNYVSTEIDILIKELTKNKATDKINVEKAISNTRAYADNAINKLLESTLMKSSTSIQKLMVEGAQSNSHGEDIADRLITYIEQILSTLFDDLPEKHFDTTKTIMWNQILKILSELIQNSITKQKPPAFFSNLRTIHIILKQIFKMNDTIQDDKKEEQIEYFLECYGFNTSRLIHQYYKDRYELQQKINMSPFNPFGVLTIHCFFIGNVLKIEILNARNLIPIGPSSKKCDSFVKVNLIPDNYFPCSPTYKTKVQQNTHFPLYDEHFEFVLTEEQRKMDDAIIFFNIKDKHLVGMFNECIAEAFVTFKDIPEFTAKVKLHLTLTRLQCDRKQHICFKLFKIFDNFFFCRT